MNLCGIHWLKVQLRGGSIAPNSAEPRRNPPTTTFPLPAFLKLEAKNHKFEDRIKRSRMVESMSSAMVPLRSLGGAILIALCVLVPQASAESVEAQYCDKNAEYEVKVRGVDISPYPIRRGIGTIFTIFLSTDKEVSGGRVEIDVSYLGFHVHNEIHDLCEEMSCPVLVGDFVLSNSLQLP